MIVHQKIVRYSEEYKLVTVSQQGFKERRDILTNVLIYIEALTTAMYQRMSVDVNYLHCRKAFLTKINASCISNNR